jgi:LemA protein
MSERKQGFQPNEKEGNMITAAVVILIGGSLLFFLIALYNRLVRLRNTVQSSWSDIDVQLKKRYDLVPNLVETVKGYAAHEKSVLEQVTQARSSALQAASPSAKAQAENHFQETLKSLFALAESYPDLKANVNFAQLQSQLQALEDNLESARRYYNAVVRDYNTLIESFPSNLVASSFQFSVRDFFELEAPATERQPVKVSFS